MSWAIRWAVPCGGDSRWAKPPHNVAITHGDVRTNVTPADMYDRSHWESG